MAKTTVYIHKTTTNKSFLAMHKLLKDLGIQNNKFFLRLFDKKLADIDPFSETLTLEQKARILKEIKVNPWYFIREIIRIPESGNSFGCAFKLHRGNLALLWCLFNNINAIQILPRQNFKTISACCFFCYQFDFGTESSEFLFMNKEFDDAKKNIKRAVEIRRLYPLWMKFKDKRDRGNIEYIYKEQTRNTIKAISTALDSDRADKLGRGLTSPSQWYDEFAFLKFNRIIHGAASPAFSQAALSAAANGKCYGKLITTTPSNLDLPHGRFCMDLIEDSVNFIEDLYDMSKEEINAYIQMSQNDYVYIFYSYKQLGRNEEWFRQQCRNLNNDMVLVKREVLCEWTYSADNSPFSEDELQEIENFKKDPISNILFKKRYSIDVYEELDADREYIVSVDVSGGLSRDYSAVILSDPYDLRTVAAFISNKMDTPELEELLFYINEQMPNAFFIIERNSYGLSVIQHLEQNYSMNKRLFYSETIDKETKKRTRTVGIDTSAKTRPKILEAFSILVTEEPYTIVSPLIIKDTKALEIKKNGKVEHVSGGHDDTVMAKAFAKYCMIHHYSTMKKFLNGADLGVNKKGRKLVDISKFNRRDYSPKREYSFREMNGRIEPEPVPDSDAAMSSKLYGVVSINRAEKVEEIELFRDAKKKTINPEEYFNKANKPKIGRKILIL